MSTSPGAPIRATAIAGSILALVLTACSGGGSPAPATGSPGPSASSGPSASPDATSTPAAKAVVLLQVSSEGGFINPSASLAALPTVVVYADGRVLTQAAPPQDNPDPLLPRVSVRDLGSTGAAAIFAAIQAAGLDKPSTEDPGVSADSGVSVFAVAADGAVVTTRFAANGPGPGLPGGGGGGSPERTAAFDLLNRLLDTTDAWGGPAAPESAYAPLGYRVFVAPGAAPDPGAPASVAWPLAAGLADFGTPAVPDRGVTGLRSGVVLGPDAVTLGPVLDAAVAGTTFTSGGATFMAWIRPLLPHELPG